MDGISFFFTKFDDLSLFFVNFFQQKHHTILRSNQIINAQQNIQVENLNKALTEQTFIIQKLMEKLNGDQNVLTNISSNLTQIQNIEYKEEQNMLEKNQSRHIFSQKKFDNELLIKTQVKTVASESYISNEYGQFKRQSPMKMEAVKSKE